MNISCELIPPPHRCAVKPPRPPISPPLQVRLKGTNAYVIKLMRQSCGPEVEDDGSRGSSGRRASWWKTKKADPNTDSGAKWGGEGAGKYHQITKIWGRGGIAPLFGLSWSSAPRVPLTCFLLSSPLPLPPRTEQIVSMSARCRGSGRHSSHTSRRSTTCRCGSGVPRLV